MIKYNVVRDCIVLYFGIFNTTVMSHLKISQYSTYLHAIYSDTSAIE